jgi:glucan phosphoethanolaminetransferase (alkaline phosphatase superfamily)
MNQSRVLWSAIAFSTVIYMVIVYTMFPTPPRPFEESVKVTMTLILYLAAFAEFVMGLVLPSVRKSPPRQKMIVSMSMFVSCAICGLLAAFFQQDWRLYLPTWILAIAGFIHAFPKDEQVAA